MVGCRATGPYVGAAGDDEVESMATLVSCRLVAIYGYRCLSLVLMVYSLLLLLTLEIATLLRMRGRGC